MKYFAQALLLFLLSIGEATAASQPSFKYRPVTQADLDQVRNIWKSRDLSAQDVEIVHQEDRDGFRLLIVRHNIASRAHFGAVFVPDIDDLSGTPVIVLPDGLEQDNPTYDMEVQIHKYQSQFEPLETMRGFIQILPSFRGRFLSHGDANWFSRGDFCDAFDGAADDSIAMLSATQHLIPEANFDEVLVWGGSRGGNTALLMAVRDRRVSTVIAAAAPVDFYREDWQADGSDQYRCQFFDGKNEQESRTLMLASSPLYFSPHDNLKEVFLHHDAGDSIVPIWNEQEIAMHLKSHAVNVTEYIYDTQQHGAMLGEESHWSNLHVGISTFLDGLAN